jgi:hypothetical protein
MNEDEEALADTASSPLKTTNLAGSLPVEKPTVQRQLDMGGGSMAIVLVPVPPPPPQYVPPKEKKRQKKNVDAGEKSKGVENSEAGSRAECRPQQ